MPRLCCLKFCCNMFCVAACCVVYLCSGGGAWPVSVTSACAKKVGRRRLENVLNVFYVSVLTMILMLLSVLELGVREE